MRLILFRQMLVTIPGAKGEVLFRVLPAIAAKEKEGRLLCPPCGRPAGTVILLQRRGQT